MARCILHVGMHKTGSSSIQATLGNVDLPGVAVLKTTDANQSGLIRTAFDNPARLARGRAKTRGPGTAEVLKKRRGRFRSVIADFLAENAAQDVIISAEGFDNLSKAAFKDFLSLVPHQEISVIAYVRPPHGHMESAIQQRIKSGATDISQRPPIPRYERVLSKYNAPKIDFQPVLFSKSTLRNGCVVQDFFNRIGHAIEPEQVAVSNEGVSRDAVSLVLVMNLWRIEQGLLPLNMNRVAPWLETLKGPKLTIHPNAYAEAAQLNQGNIAWVEKLLGHDFTPRDPLPDDIRDLSELLTPSDAAVAWLRAQGADDDGIPEAMNTASRARLRAVPVPA
jgi:hypothetical protein